MVWGMYWISITIVYLVVGISIIRNLPHSPPMLPKIGLVILWMPIVFWNGLRELFKKL